MRKMFRGYYYPTKDEFSELWEKGIFIFDANILLNIYRYSDDTRELFIKILTEISDRTIIPHQAAKEYQDNRLKVIRDQKNAYSKVITNLQSEFDNIKTDLNSYKRHPSINRDEIIKELDSTFKKVINDLKDKDKCHIDLFKKDDLRDKLTVLLDGKIWKPCPTDVMDDIWKEGKARYDNELPPGYKDKKDKEGFKKCGDLILWYQIIDIAKKKHKPIILVTDDKKEDWWWESGGKTIGPRQELVEEIYNESNVLFYMYKTDNFIKYAEKTFFNIDTDPSVIKEVKDAMSENQIIDKSSSKNFYIGGGIYSPFSSISINGKNKELNELYNLFNNIKHGKNYTKKDLFDLNKLLNRTEKDMVLLRERLIDKEDEMIGIGNILSDTSSSQEYFELSTQKDLLQEEISFLIKEITKSEDLYDFLKNLHTKIEGKL